MGIVSSLPFEFSLKRIFPGGNSREALGAFYDSEEEAWEHSQESYQATVYKGLQAV